MKQKLSLLAVVASLFLVGCNNQPSSSSPISSSSEPTSTSTTTTSSESASSQVISSSETSTSSSSSSIIAPTSVSLQADKENAMLSDTVKITLTVEGGNEEIVPEVDIKASSAEAELVENQDGSYSLSLDKDSRFGGVVVVKATSLIDSSVTSSVSVNFVSAVSSEHQKYLNRAFSTLDEGGVSFDGQSAPTTASLAFSKKDDDSYLLDLAVDGTTYSYFSIYDFSYNEIKFGSKTVYTSAKDKALNTLTLKLFDMKVEVIVGSLNLSFSTDEQIPVPFNGESVSFKTGGVEIDEETVYEKKIGDNFIIGISHDFTTEELSYSFEVINGSDYVTKENLSGNQSAKFTINNNAAGQTIVIKASLTHNEEVFSKTMTISVEDVSYTFCEDLIGTWQYTDYMYYYVIEVVAEDDISVKVVDDLDEPDEEQIFTVSDIKVISDTAVQLTIGSDEDDIADFVSGETITIEYDDGFYVTSENFDFVQFEPAE